MKLCTVCGVVTSRPGSRCTAHARQSNRSRHNALYGTRTWQRLSARVLRAWRGQHGNWCPGYGRDPHPASDLTADHIVPLAAGGASLDPGNLAVLCRSCNSTKGAREADRGYPHTGSALAEDRVEAGGTVAYVAGKKVGGTATKPKAMKVKTMGVAVAGGFPFPARFAELGTVNQPARPFLTPALMATVPDAAPFIKAKVAARLRAVR